MNFYAFLVVKLNCLSFPKLPLTIISKYLQLDNLEITSPSNLYYTPFIKICFANEIELRFIPLIYTLFSLVNFPLNVLYYFKNWY